MTIRITNPGRRENARIVRSGKAKEVKNLGWLLKHAADVESFEVLPLPKAGGLWDAVLRAHLYTVDDEGIKTAYPKRTTSSGDYFETEWADRGVLAEWLQRPVFKGASVNWMGKKLTAGPDLDQFIHPTRRNNPSWEDTGKMRLRLSYGQLPTKAQFLAAFDEEMDDKGYGVDLKGEDARVAKRLRRLPEQTFSGLELYDFVKQLVQADASGENDDAGNLASSILYTLGIEWI